MRNLVACCGFSTTVASNRCSNATSIQCQGNACRDRIRPPDTLTHSCKFAELARIQPLPKSIEHCISVIALCRVGGHPRAEASYETYLAQLNTKLEELLKEKDQQEEEK